MKKNSQGIVSSKKFDLFYNGYKNDNVFKSTQFEYSAILPDETKINLSYLSVINSMIFLNSKLGDNSLSKLVIKSADIYSKNV